MRINIYSQELTKEVILVKKADERGNVHYGVRFYLASPEILHHTDDDDDRSAVTFWIPNCGQFRPTDLVFLFTMASGEAMEACVEMNRAAAKSVDASAGNAGTLPTAGA